ncbi:MAG: YicC family protein [Bacteroidales bacterium]|nr:YicC family protein [Bacteroidales bacterium]
MTGFAKKTTSVGGKNYTIEIKSLNSKQMDATVKLPSSMKQLELDVRALIGKLERGKIDFLLSEENPTTSSSTLDTATAICRYEQISQLAETLEAGVGKETLFSIIMQQNDLWVANQVSTLPDEEKGQLLNAIEDAIAELDATRLHEGAIMKIDIAKHVDQIEEYLHQIPPYEQERITTAKERMRNYLAEAAVKDVDENRFEQELIYYLEKLDITEEKVRLAKHINYFRDVMDHEESSGKKLAFIAQEMGREINTTGSKANHVEIQRLVVGMKDELEKIKEQLGNIL